MPEFMNQFSRKQAQNARVQLLKTSVLGLTGITGSINSGTGLILDSRLPLPVVMLLFYSTGPFGGRVYLTVRNFIVF